MIAVCDHGSHDDATVPLALRTVRAMPTLHAFIDEAGNRSVSVRVTRRGVFVCECRTPEEVAAAGVPVADLVEEESEP